MNSKRDFDVIVWGATGFTGALVAEYLLERYGVTGELRWAIAGRSQQKLDRLKSALGDGAAALDTVVGDSFDDAALDTITSRSAVILSTVGPYAHYGSPLVAACVRNGTHYCDLAGEVQWIRQMIDQHHDDAKASGARIVHCCGFDSIPMDIGVWFLQQEAMQRFGSYCQSITMLLKSARGGASGGTYASLVNVVKESRKDRDIARILVHPYSLNPDGERNGPDGRDQQGVAYDKTANSWTAPFVMAAVNTKIVRRSNALLDYPWGRDFQYREAVMTSPGAKGWLGATAVTVGIGALVFAASFDLTRGVLERRILPKAGEGPDRDARENGYFNLRQFGTFEDGSVLRSKITGDRDPGYGSTSKMLGESAVCLAKDDLEAGGGVWTPAAVMARPLLDRLVKNAGLTFDILD